MNNLEFRKNRLKLGLTQVELAEKLSVTSKTIKNYEKGELIPDSKVKLFNLIFNGENKYINQNETLNMVLEPVEGSQKGVPYYDIDFTSGFLEVINNQSIKPDAYISHPFFKGCDYVVRNSGQSMAKLIAHGDAIGLVNINNWKEFFPFGEVYAIVTNDGFRMVKIITKGETEQTYTLISKPMDSKKDDFPPQQIKKTSIISIFKVQASSHLF